MNRRKSLTGKEICRALKKLSFELIRQKGSHTFWRHPDGRCTVIPVHKGEILGRGLIQSVLNDIELTPEELKEVL